MFNLGLYALAAGAATAFMIPPDSDASFNILPHVESTKSPLQTFGVDPYTNIVKVPCSGPSGHCPFAAELEGKSITWVKNQENYLVLNISVSADSQSLLWNGVPFYPPELGLSGHMPEVVQFPGSPYEQPASNVRVATPARSLRATSYSVRSKSLHTSPESKEQVIDVHLSVHAIEQQSILIHDIVIGIVKDQKADLLILASGVSKEAPMKLCQKMPIICQWRGIIGDKVEGMRHKMKGKGGCHKHHGFGMLDHGKRPHRPHYKTHHAHPHHHKTHHHHHHLKMHGFIDKAARVMLNIVIPILLGVLAGMVTYLVGLAVGTGLARAWIKFRRYHRGEYNPISLDENDEEPLDTEKGEYVVEEQVEAPPVYVEVEATEAGQK